MARPLSFDPQLKLDEAMRLFWEFGYAGLSVENLTEHLNLNKFSLYKQYGSKSELYAMALTRYADHIYFPLLEPLRVKRGKSSVQKYFDQLGHQIYGPGGDYGCLINNTLLAAESMPKICIQQASRYAKTLQQLLNDNFYEAASKAELRAKPQDCVNFTLMTIQALLNTRKRLGPFITRSNLNFFTTQIEGW